MTLHPSTISASSSGDISSNYWQIELVKKERKKEKKEKRKKS
jgi:hypothetical protein